MRHADIRRESIAVIAKPAPALWYDTAVGTWYGCAGVCFVMG